MMVREGFALEKKPVSYQQYIKRTILAQFLQYIVIRATAPINY